ncbi:MAG: spermidine synthase [Chthoniobacterales bacterium]
MSRDFEELDYQKTALGELTLRRRVMHSLDDLTVYEVKLGDAFLMSSLFHEVEVALSHLGLGELRGRDWDVVVGGLGLGYTAVAALEHPEVRALRVVDALAPVIGWHQRGLVPLGPQLAGDTRCQLVEGDFFALAASAEGFDEGQPGRRFDAILLDIDHSPRDLLHPRNATFYTPAGLAALAAHLLPDGVFAMWSDEAPDEEFMQVISSAFISVRAHVVTFANPLLDSQSASTVYVAQKADAG